MQHHLTNRIIHHGQARVAADEQLLGGNAQHLTEDHFAVGNTGKIPVVTAVGTIGGQTGGLGIDHIKKAVCEVKLIG